jgi:AIPR protein
MNTLELYYEDFMGSLSAGASANQNFMQSQFFEKVCEILIEDGVVFEPNYYPYQNIGLRIDGLEYAEDRGVLNLFVCDFEEDKEIKNLTKTDIDNTLKKAEKFFIKSLEVDFHKKLEETSEGYSAAEFIYSHRGSISEIRFFLFSNKYLSSKVKNIKIPDVAGYKTSLDIWDIDRLFQSETTKGQTEAIEINFADDFKTIVPALPVCNSYDAIKSFLCVISGNTVADLYEKYGSRLLEANIRSFLQFRASINKGLRKTIRECPEMFFSYNNGITATAEEVELDDKGNICKLKNLQIVNGGQTTASLYSTRKRDKADLTKIFIQMKLSIVNADQIQEIVPNISKYANTQNKVSDSDFFANHEFHRRTEEQSRRIWAPRKANTLKQSKWFYERARGQYLEQQANLSDAKKREFGEIYPKSQLFNKTDLAKVFVIFEGYPNNAVKGAQISFKFFADKIVDKWETAEEIYNDLFFKHIIAKFIIFRSCQQLVANNKDFRGQDRAIIVAYSIFALKYMIEKEGLTLDYMNVWDHQEVQECLQDELIAISQAVNRFLLNETSRSGFTVLSYSKTENCLKNIKAEINDSGLITLSDTLRESLIGKHELASEIRSAKAEKKIDNGIEAQTKVLSISAKKWQEITELGKKAGIITLKEMEILKIAMLIPKRIPTDKQSVILMDIYDRVIQEGLIAA